jgi:hypothetical protein
MPVAGSMSHCSGVWMIESCNRWPSMLSRPSLQLDADAMQMRVQSMPLFAADAGSWIDVILLRRVDGRELQPMAIDAQPAITPARSYAMQMRVQSMPLAEIDGGCCVWVSCSRC